MELFNTSKNLLDRAADGESQAQYQLGLIFCIKENVYEAEYWFRLAAKNGHRYAKEVLKEMEEKNLIGCKNIWVKMNLKK